MVRPPVLPTPLRVLVLGLVVAAVAWWVRQRGTKVPAPRGQRASVALLAIFVVTYCILLGAAELATLLNLPDDRTLAPVYVPIVFLGLVVVDKAFTTRSDLAAAAKAGVLALVAYQLASAVYLATPSAQKRLSWFEGPRWTSSPLMAHVRSIPATADLFTNQPEGVYYRTGRLIERLPSRTGSEALRSTVTVVWFEEDVPEPFDALRRRLTLEPVLVVEGGAVYRVSPRPPGGDR